jgi:hypothetical protein
MNHRKRVPSNHLVTTQFSIKRSGRHLASAAPPWAATILASFRKEDVRNLVFLPDTVMGRLLALAEAQEDDFSDWSASTARKKPSAFSPACSSADSAAPC